jgi:RimJ/RimL family protein N-acetyltransferase
MMDSDATAFLQEMSQAPIFTPGTWSQIGIAQTHTPKLIGDIGLHLVQDQSEGEIGFTLKRQFHGKSLASEAGGWRFNWRSKIRRQST